MIHSIHDHPGIIQYDTQGNVLSRSWFTHGQRHRDAAVGPAYISRVEQVYYNLGAVNRSDGPAIIHADGSVEWWRRSRQSIDFTTWLAENKTLEDEEIVMLKLQYG